MCCVCANALEGFSFFGGFFLRITERHLHTAVIGQVPPFGCISCFLGFFDFVEVASSIRPLSLWQHRWCGVSTARGQRQRRRGGRKRDGRWGNRTK